MIHAATSRDFPQLLDLQVACISGLGDTYSDKEIDAWITYIKREGVSRYTPYSTRILTADERIIGFVSWSTNKTEGTTAIECLYIAKMHQGKGLGRRLLQDVESILPKDTRISVRSTLNARPFYESNKFRHIEDTSSRAGFSISILEKQL
jgi:GNAT superfamily N-acetyltransferase